MPVEPVEPVVLVVFVLLVVPVVPLPDFPPVFEEPEPVVLVLLDFPLVFEDVFPEVEIFPPTLDDAELLERLTLLEDVVVLPPLPLAEITAFPVGQAP